MDPLVRENLNAADRLRRMRREPALDAVLSDYTKLRSWSEQARYTHSHDLFKRYQSRIALDIAQFIREHVRNLMRSSE